jgi:hypothetical protein
VLSACGVTTYDKDFLLQQSVEDGLVIRATSGRRTYLSLLSQVYLKKERRRSTRYVLEPVLVEKIGGILICCRQALPVFGDKGLQETFIRQHMSYGVFGKRRRR